MRAVGFKQSPQPLECMAVGGAFCPATASGTGPCPAQALAASIYGGQWSSSDPAVASACRLSLPGGSQCVQAQPARWNPGGLARVQQTKEDFSQNSPQCL